MTLITNYATVKPTSAVGNVNYSAIWWIISPKEGATGETYAQFGQIPITSSGRYVIAARTTTVTPPSSGNTTQNGPLPVWAGNFQSFLVQQPDKTVAANKSYLFEFTVPATVKTLTWRLCAPNGGMATWVDVFVGLKTDYDQLKKLNMAWFNGNTMPLNS